MSTGKHEERAHARLSASGAERWVNCPVSVKLEERYPDETSEYAKEGTLAHEVAEQQMLMMASCITKRAYNTRVNKLFKSYGIPRADSDIEQEVEPYSSYVIEELRESEQKGPAKFLLEERVDLTSIIPGGFGTCDAIIVTDGVLHVIDLKFGKGVSVSAVHNKQLMLYAFGALQEYAVAYSIEHVVMTIHQPRLDSVSTYEMPAEELEAWAYAEIKPAAELAASGGGPQKCGDWCKWCKAKPRCRALSEQALAIAKTDFADPTELTDAELMKLRDMFSTVKTWMASVEGYMLAEAMSGKVWPRLKVVEGTSRRKWTDEAAAGLALTEKGFQRKDVYKESLLGITAAEKLVGKQAFRDSLVEFVVKPAGKKVLVPADDPRPVVAVDPSKDFD